MKKEIFSKVKEYCTKTGISSLIDDSSAVVVGFSGGADSLFLLSYLKETLPSEKKLFAVHLNHMLRGEEADRDEAFCSAFCAENGILFASEKADVNAISKQMKKGIEECARDVRYALFGKCRKELAAECSVPEEKILIATAHNSDDNMETVIFNITRGSSASGLCGIPPIRDGKYIRPILCLTSLEIREYLEENNIGFVFDSTNAENDYTRNRIRHKVVTSLREINPSVEKAFSRLSEATRRDEDYFEGVVLKLLDFEREKGEVPVSVLRNLHPSILSRTICKLYSEVSEGSLASVNISDISEMIAEGKRGELHLPDKITVSLGDSVKFFYENDKVRENIAPFCRELKDGMNMFSDLDFILSVDGIEIERGAKNDGSCVKKSESSEENKAKFQLHDNVYKSLINITLNNDKIKGTVFVRNRRESDVYLLGGHHRKVKKLFCDKKIPREKRDILPIICDEEGIIWIPGFPPRDGCAYKGEGKKLMINYYFNK